MNKDAVKKRMTELEALIRETKKRLPAHSPKPPVMMELLGYEDEYDELERHLKALNKISLEETGKKEI